jgi:predicted dehydrogenase
MKEKRDETLRIGIVGLGAVTGNIHLPAYQSLKPQVQVVGGVDVDEKARVTALEKWKLPAVYESLSELIARSKPDIVAICSPPALHHEQCFEALELGCHVFCEKPFVETLTQADEIIQASERTGRRVVVNNQFPYMNIHSAAKEMIGSPEFGRLLYLHAWQTFRPTDMTEAGWRGTMRRRLGYEFGVHVYELIRFFFADEPLRIFAHIPDPGHGHKSDVVNIVSVEFANGCAASVVLDRLSKGPERYLDMRLDGEFGSIHTSIGGEVKFHAGVFTRERRPYFGFSFVKGGKAVLQDGNRSKTIAKDDINPFASSTAVLLDRFIKALRDGSEPPVSARSNRKTLALALAAYDSAESGKAVDMRQYASKGDLK